MIDDDLEWRHIPLFSDDASIVLQHHIYKDGKILT